MVLTGNTLRSGELAGLCGVSADTIRHYDRIGILAASPRAMSGYRLYGPEAVHRVRLARNALQLGFSLPELSEILGVRDRGGVPCRTVFELAQEKLRSLRKQIAELGETERSMQQMVRKWRGKLARTQPSSKALLLHDLNTKPPRSRRSVDNLKRRRDSSKIV